MKLERVIDEARITDLGIPQRRFAKVANQPTHD